MKTKSKIFGMLIVVLMIAACSLHYTMTAKKVAIWANNVYSAQYDDYLAFFEPKTPGDPPDQWIVKDNVSAEQRKVLAKKYEYLEDMEEAKNAINTFIAIGYMPEGKTLESLEREIVNLVRKLEGL